MENGGQGMHVQKTAAVTGASGFIGTHIVRALCEKEWSVVALDIAAPNERLPGVAYELCDVRHLDDLRKHFAGVQAVFHLAALPRVQYSIEQPLETHETNLTGTQNALVAAHEAGVRRVVYSSSSSVYGDQDTMPLVETMAPDPKSPYGLHKLAGEFYARVWSSVYGLQTVSLRYFNVYGPGASAEGAYALVIAKFLKQLSSGEPMTITGDGTQTRDFTHVRDVVQANILAAERASVGRGEVINIGSGRNTSVNRIAELFGGATEHIEPRFEPHDTLADISRADELLGWRPSVSLEEGIAELKEVAGL